MGPFHDVVTSLDELRALLGEPSELAQKKQVDRLDELRPVALDTG